MRVLLTGGAGFLGRHVAAALLEAGHAATSVDLAPWPDAPGSLRVIQGSILEDGALAEGLERADAVIHLAAFPHLWARDAGVYERLNHQGTRFVLRRARQAGVRRFLYVGSPTLFAAKPLAKLARPLDEDDRAEPFELPDGYARSKRRAELATLASNAAGFETLCVIPTIPVGPGDVSFTPPSRMIADVAAGRTPAFLDCWMNLVDVRDVARGLVSALHKARGGERYILGGENLRMGALMERLAPLMDRTPPTAKVPGVLALAAAFVSEKAAALGGPAPVAPMAGVLSALRARPFDMAKARDELGFAPRPLDRALADALRDLKARGHV